MLSDPALDAALRSAGAALGGARLDLYLGGPDGRLVRACPLRGEPDLAGVAEVLSSEAVVLDLRRVAEGVGDAVGIGWAAPRRGALLALLPDTPVPGASARLADAAAVVQALTARVGVGPVPVAPSPDPPASTPAAFEAVHLLADLATFSGPFDDHLAMAMERLAALLAMDAATVALVGDGEWQPLAAFDPLGLTPTTPVPLAGTPGALIAVADGPVGVADGGEAFGAFLGAPVCVGGRCEAVLCAVACEARAPFTDTERDLVAALARWAAAALAGRQAALRLVDREATLAAFLDTVPLALGTLDLDAEAPGGVRLVTANVNAARAIGATDLLPADAVTAALAPWAGACRSALASGTAARFAVTVGAEEHARCYEATVAVLDAAGPRFSFVAEDVTERHGAALAAARPDRSAAEARHALLSQVAHDLRSPLTAILGYADLLSASATPADVEEACGVLVRACGRMVEAIEGLGMLAFVDADRASRNVSPVDAAAVVAAVSEAYLLPALTRRTALTLDVLAPPAPILADPELFDRLLRTLVGAAVAATSDGRIDGRLVVDGDALVFDLQAHPAEPGDGLGTIGADVVRRLVALMGGTVDAGHDGDTLGVAWRWTIRLPYCLAPVGGTVGLVVGEDHAVDVLVATG